MSWYERGDTLIEVTVALAILATVLTSAYALINLTFRVGQTAKERTQAVDYAQEQAEALRSYRDKNQAAFATTIGANTGAVTGNFHMELQAGKWTPAANGGSGVYPIAGTLYSVNVTRSNPAASKYRFTIAVSWTSDVAGTATNTSTLDTDLVDTSGLVPCDNSVSGTCI